MGLDRVVFVSVPGDGNVVEALAAAVRPLAPDLLVAGERSEGDAANGMLPYLLAELLGSPLLAEVAALRLCPDGVEAEQRLGRGLVRRIGAVLPVIITVGAKGPMPRQVAFGRAHRACIETVEVGSSGGAVRIAERLRPAAPPRPAIDAVADLGVGVVRSAATSAPTPEAAAEAILAELAAAGFDPTEKEKTQ